MSARDLTTRAYWVEYWRENAVDKLIDERFGSEGFDRILTTRRVRTAIELGGFPGYYSIWLHKYHGIQADLLDFVVDAPTLERVLATNGLAPGAIGATEADLFEHTPKKKYDLVFSKGLIEHFVDVRRIVAQHVQFLADDGTLLLTVPNFLGLNGLIQRLFDPENFARHNREAMEPARLTRICEDLGLDVERAGYYKRFGVWLEERSAKPRTTRALVRAIELAGKAIELVPVETRWFSPQVLVVARRRGANSPRPQATGVSLHSSKPPGGFDVLACQMWIKGRIH